MENEKLIELVRKHEILYTLNNKEYKNVIKKDEIWTGIGKELNVSADTCKKRWKSLRDSYRRHKKNSQAPSGSGASCTTSKYKYNDTLSFLSACVDSRETVGNIDGDISVDLMNDSSQLDIEEISTSLNESDTVEPATKKCVQKKRKADADVTKIFSETMQECMETIKSIAGSDSVSDLTANVFNTLAKQITDANLPSKRARLIERKVIRLVNDELENYEFETSQQ